MPQIDLEAIQAKIDSQSLTLSEKQPSATIGDYDSEQRKLVNWFFASMRTQWGAAKYNSQFGEGDDVQFAKRHWAPRIVKYSPEQLNDMLNQADSQRISGNDKFAWPDPAAILSLSSSTWERQCHKPYVPPERTLENLTAKERRIEAGRQALSSLRKLDYSDRPKRKQPTSWEGKTKAEDAWFKTKCDAMLKVAHEKFPDCKTSAKEFFFAWQGDFINHYWGS